MTTFGKSIRMAGAFLEVKQSAPAPLVAVLSFSPAFGLGNRLIKRSETKEHQGKNKESG